MSQPTGGGPLRGVTVLVTRAKAQAGALQAQIHAQGGETWDLPVIASADPTDWGPLDAALAELPAYRWLVITSANGAEAVVRRLGGDVGALAGVRVAAVGTATAGALERLGVRVDLVPATFRGAALPTALAAHLAPGDRILMARADIADPGPAQALRALGYRVDDVVAYRTILQSPDVGPSLAALADGRIAYATFTSSSTVRGLVTALGGTAPLQGVRIAVIGPETATAARAAGLPVHVQAHAATIPGLVAALVADVAARRTPGSVNSD